MSSIKIIGIYRGTSYREALHLLMENLRTQKKNKRARTRSTNKPNPHMASGPGFEPGPCPLVKGECIKVVLRPKK